MNEWQKYFDKPRPIIFCFGCSFTSIGGAAEKEHRGLDDWPKYLAQYYPNFNVVNLAVGGTSLQYAVMRLSKIINMYPKNQNAYKTILQITTQYRYTVFDDDNYDDLLNNESILSITDNYAKTEHQLDIPGQRFTVGLSDTRPWKKHWWKNNWLREYPEHYIQQDFFGNALLAKKAADFVFSWHDYDLNIRNRFGFDIENYAIKELGGEDFVQKNYCYDGDWHFNTAGAKAVGEWIGKKTKWK